MKDYLKCTSLPMHKCQPPLTSGKLVGAIKLFILSTYNNIIYEIKEINQLKSILVVKSKKSGFPYSYVILIIILKVMKKIFIIPNYTYFMHLGIYLGR